MSVIYEPSGKAREYSPLALNLYLSCTHHCLYCYVPSVIQKPREEYFKIADPRTGLAKKLRNELARHAPREQVFLSFVGDPYSGSTDDNRVTRDCLEALYEYNVPVAILTKSGSRCLMDLDLFKAFGSRIQVGASLTFHTLAKSRKWEDGAADPANRLATLERLHGEGIKTWASMEPVIEAEESLGLIRESLMGDYIDHYKVGKINNYQGLDKKVDWTFFLGQTVSLLRTARKTFYIKEELRHSAPSIALTPVECDMDAHHLGERKAELVSRF